MKFIIFENSDGLVALPFDKIQEITKEKDIIRINGHILQLKDGNEFGFYQIISLIGQGETVDLT